MLAVTVEFLHGTVRATGADDVALSGREGSAEWPPSPARLYQALVASDGTRDRCRVTAGDVGLELLESSPQVRAVDSDGAVMTVLEPRFVVMDDTGGPGVQNYPARTAQEVRPGVRLSLRDPRVAYLWPDAHPTPDELDSLRLRAARVGYLGCSDSPVRVGVSDEPPRWADDLPLWAPDPDGDVAVPVAAPGFLQALDRAFDAWTDGVPRRRAWLATPMAWYRAPTSAESSVPAGTTVWMRFDRPVNARRVVVVAETLRAAVLEKYEARVGSRDLVPEVLHGHQPPGTAQEHVRWLPLPTVGHRHADGRIRGACVWLPPGTPDEIVDGVRQAVASITTLIRSSMFGVGVELFDGTRTPWSTNPLRWTRPARRWVTAFPATFERFTRGDLSLSEVSRWCVHAGLPEPVAARSAKVPLIEGAAVLHPSDASRAGDQRRPYRHLEVEFAEAVPGPVVLGHGRHFGLGLCCPEPDSLPR